MRSALADRKSRCEAQWHASHPEGGAVAVPSGVDLRFTTLGTSPVSSPQLAALCPVPETVAPGLSDLMVNAIEHGNLGVTYREKALLKWEGRWEVEIGRRLALPQFRDRYATVRWERQGRASYSPSPIRATDSTGRSTWNSTPTGPSTPTAGALPWPA